MKSNATAIATRCYVFVINIPNKAFVSISNTMACLCLTVTD